MSKLIHLPNKEILRPNFPLVVGVRYEFECFRNGKLEWKDGFDNLVVTEGRNELLDRLVKNVPANVLWYVGLKDIGAPVAADTMASHASWSEIAPYSDANRPGFTAGTISAGSVDNSASKASFSINAADNVFGAFLSSDNTKSGTSGKLFGAGEFASGVITGATQANPVSITSTAHGLTTGQTVRITGVGGMTEINNRNFTITNTGANTFTLDGEDGTGHTAYTSGGLWTRYRAVDNGDTLNIQLTLSITAS